jgi:hypothetical protein
VRAISLFTGAGGLDLGCEAAGFLTAAAVENSEVARDTLLANALWGAGAGSRCLEQSPAVNAGRSAIRRSARRLRVRISRGMRRRFLNWAVNQRPIVGALRREVVLCVGDSHIGVFHDVEVPGLWFRPYVIGGATASGILNPNSQTESFKLITARLTRAPRWQQVLLLLGEVDCNYLIWHRAQRLGLSVDEQLDITLSSYAGMIDRIVRQGFRRVLVLSVPLPAIADSTIAEGRIARLRSQVKASRSERTELTQRFNQELARRCSESGAVFVDVTSGQLDAASGVIHPRFVRENPRNIHLTRGPYSELIADQLRRLF